MTHRRLLVAAVIAGAFLVTAGLSDSASASRVDEGREVFTANCAMCHGQDATGMMGMHPSLRGAVDRLSVEGVEVAIRNGRDTNPPMPAFGDRLSASEIDAAISYLASLPDGPRNFGPDAGEGMMDGGMMGGDNGNGLLSGWGPALGLGVLLGVTMALGAVAAVAAARRHRASPSRSPARDELDRRYAAGELPRDDYLQRRRDIE